MKRRNPLFVAVFPYLLAVVGYVGVVIVNPTNESIDLGIRLAVFFGFFCLLAAGSIYVWYWLISTGRVLRAQTKAPIPNALLLLVPLANYWWMWRYSQAAEEYTREKQQAALVFVLIALLGSIGLGILQDIYNKLDGQHQPLPDGSRYPTHQQ